MENELFVKCTIHVIDIICGIEESVKNFRTKALANEFRFVCKKILKQGRIKRDNNRTEKLCNGLKTWLKQNKLSLTENGKGRATFIISNANKQELISKELENTERYKELVKDDIAKVKTNTNKELVYLTRQNLISQQKLKSLKQITSKTLTARPALKRYKNPIKVRLIMDTVVEPFTKYQS